MDGIQHFLATKICLPSATTTLVTRPRLRDHLSSALRRPLTIVITPPGFGKTTLVSTWAAEMVATDTAAVAWLTLDRYDDDPARFWMAVIAALQTVDPTLGHELLTLLSKHAPAPPERVLALLINQLAERRTTPIVLVLDDYHVVGAQAIHAAVGFFVDHLPPHVHLILASRSDPPLPLARLRGHGLLTELRATDLCFTAQEASYFLNDVMGLELAAETVMALEARTEGWIVGLHLAALSMQNRSDRTEFVQSLSGTYHFILDYLIEEVLQRQPASIRSFLLQTAVLDQFCASLCNAVTGNSDAATILEIVDHANLFLISLDDERRWYRYHHLFAEMLRARLAYEMPLLVPVVHQRASDWYAEHAAGETSMYGQAIHHALAANNGERAAQIIDATVATLWGRNETTMLHTWCMALPNSVLHSHPRHALRLAQIRLVNGLLNDVPSLLDAAIATLAHMTLPPDEHAAIVGKLAVVRSYIACIAERYDEAVAQAQEALAVLPKSARPSRAIAASGLVIAYHMQGVLPLANIHYRQVIAMCETIGERYLEITTRYQYGRLLRERGDLVAAENAFKQALLRTTSEMQRLPIGGWALIGLGTIAYVRADLEAAEGLLIDGIDLAMHGDVCNALYHGRSCLIRVRIAQKDLEGARMTAAQFIQDAHDSQLPHIIEWATALHALVELHSGNLEAVSTWASCFQPRPDALFYSTKTAFATFLRVLLTQGQPVEALRLAEQQRRLAVHHDHIETTIEMHLLEAAALMLLDNPRAAHESLTASLDLAALRGFAQVFINGGESISILLAQRQQDDPQRVFIDQLLTIFMQQTAGSVQPVAHPAVADHRPGQVGRNGHALKPDLEAGNGYFVEPLSQRELDVLRLMALGLHNQQIAERLIISVPTVKKHGSNIFSKLHATSRIEAVVRARELGLLP